MKALQIQEHLMMLGYGEMLRPFGVDGKIGSKTRAAIKQFQADYNARFHQGILVEGLHGKQTYAALRAWVNQAGTHGTLHFKISEFHSKDGGGLLKGGMDSKLITTLEQLRYNLGGKAIVINSGYRTAAHNKRVGGVSNSQHLYGKAADIVVKGVKPSTVYQAADKLFNGVGKYSTFTHVDTRAGRVRF